MEIIFPITLGHQILSWILAILSLYFSISILFRKNALKKGVNISPTIILYFSIIFIYSITAIAHFSYLVIFWRPDGKNYSSFWMFLTGFMPVILLSINSIAETFLCLERCLAICFPFSYTKNRKVVFGVVTFLTLFGSSVWIIFGNNWIEAYRTNPEPNCQYFGCIIGHAFKYKYFTKTITNLVNVIFALLLVGLIKFKTPSSSTRQINRTIAILIAATTFIEIIPFLIAQGYFLIFNEEIIKYVGPYATTVLCINITLSATLYYRAFKKA